jgi:predicted nuclease of predicted toxin-antitoxin system
LAQRLYLDDSVDSRLLRRFLIDAGHAVTIPEAAGLVGARDDIHVAYAVAHGLVLVTKNAQDFEPRYEALAGHPGAFMIRADNDATRDMLPRDIVRAIANIEAAGVPIANEIHTLNHWRY